MAGAFATTTTTTTDTTNTTVAGEDGRDKKFAVMLADVGKVALPLSSNPDPNPNHYPKP